VYKDRGLGYGVIESDLSVTGPNKKMIEDGFSTKMAGSNKFKVPMLDEGMKYKSISISPGEAQFLETNKNGVLEICRWLNIAPHKLKELGNANYSNIQQQSIEHVQDSILPWIIRFEQELSKKIFTDQEKETLYVKFNEKSLLRGDLEARKNYFTAMVYAGIMTRNEARGYEDMNPIDGLDEILQPVNMQGVTIANQKNENQNGNTNQ
jgi:HK97 family phage portal protein